MAVSRASSRDADVKAELAQRVEEELNAYADLGLVYAETDNLIPKWQVLVKDEPKRFISDQRVLNLDALHNFRRLQMFVPDSPLWDKSIFRRAIRKKITGRGLQEMMRQCLEVLQEHEYADLLQKYPCHPAGNPYVFHHQGYRYTYRWVKHIYYLGLLNRVLRDKLDDNYVALDIGSSYGIYSSLQKQERPASHHVLVDFPEQLLLAYYFLAASIPGAKIAGIKEISGETSLTRGYFQANDFTLVPISYFDRIAEGSTDLVTNFASFGEMSRQWFEYYTKSLPFQTSKYFLTANRIQSYPTYDTDLTVVDYPVWDPEKRLHFGVSPPFSHVYYYLRRRLFFNEKYAYPPYFEYVGRI